MFGKKVQHDVYLGLGSNLGDRGKNLHLAINHIEERIGEIIATSAFYVTTPIGFESDNQFLNAVCQIKTQLSPIEVLDLTQSIEKELGRNNKSINNVYTDRLIDIDILLFDKEIIDHPRLTIPHPHIQNRAFVLQPLAEIAGGYTHPVLKKSVNQLKEELADNQCSSLE